MTDVEKLKKKYSDILKRLNVPVTYENIGEIRKHESHKENKAITDNYIPIIEKNMDGSLRAVLKPNEEKRRKELLEANLTVEGSYHAYQAYGNSSLKNFVQSNPERKKALNTAKGFLKAFDENKADTGLYIWGDNRTGKTFLASAIANELALKKKVVFVFFPDFKRSLTSSMYDNTIENRIRVLKQADLLVLDDFASGHTTVWFRDNVLLPIINERMSNKKPTIYTANVKYDELVQSFDTINNGTEAGIKEKNSIRRLILRIVDSTQAVELNTKVNIDKEKDNLRK